MSSLWKSGGFKFQYIRQQRGGRYGHSYTKSVSDLSSRPLKGLMPTRAWEFIAGKVFRVYSSMDERTGRS